MFYEVAGWSASLGVAWNAGWLVNNAPADVDAGVWGTQGYFGLSGIGTGQASGFAALPVPPFPLFGGRSGFNLAPVGIPEPSSIQLWSIGATVLVIFRCRRIIRPNEAHAVDAPIAFLFHMDDLLRRATDVRRSA